MLKPGTVLFAAPYTEDCVRAAKAYVVDKGLMPDDVRIYRPAYTEEYGDQVLVVARREIVLR